MIQKIPTKTAENNVSSPPTPSKGEENVKDINSQMIDEDMKLEEHYDDEQFDFIDEVEF